MKVKLILFSFIIIAGSFTIYVLISNNPNVSPSSEKPQEIQIKAPTPVDQDSIGANLRSNNNKKANLNLLYMRPGNEPVIVK